MSITLPNGTAVHVEIVSIDLVNRQSICNKSDEVSDIVKDINLHIFG